MESEQLSEFEPDRVAEAFREPAAGEKWYHVTLGATVGLWIFLQAAGGPWSWVVTLAFLFTIPLFIAWWRAEHGWWVSGYAPGRTMWVSAVMIVTIALCAGWAFWVDALWAFAVAGIIATVITSASGFVWMRIWRHGLTTQAR